MNKYGTRYWGALAVCATLGLTGCGNDDKDNAASDTTISGTAATGAAMSGTVTAVGANGAQANTTIGAGGVYTLVVDGLTFPLLIKADDGAGTTLYSWADEADDTANITPLTTLALVMTDLSDNLDDVFANWSTSHSLTVADLQAAQAKVNANLQSQFTAAGVDYTDYDFLTSEFDADGSGIDGLLDDLEFDFDFLGTDFGAVVNIVLAGTTTPVAIDADIGIDDIVIGDDDTSGGGDSQTELACDTSLFQEGAAISLPTSEQWAAFAKSYTVDEGSYDDSFNFVKNGTGTLVLGGTLGSVSYNETNYTPTSVCIEDNDTYGLMLYLHFEDGHVDVFENGDVSGESPNGSTSISKLSSDNSGSVGAVGVTIQSGNVVEGPLVFDTPIVNVAGGKIGTATTGTAVLEVYDYVNSLSVSARDTMMSTVFDTGYNACALNNSAVNADTPMCSEIGVEFNRSAGALTFTNTAMKPLVFSCPGDCTINGTISFDPY